MAIRILAIGKRHEAWVEEGITRYQSRLRRPFEIEWVLLPHSAREGATARIEESQRLLGRIQGSDHVILLDERGTLFDSPTASHMLLEPLEQSRGLVLVIGGAYGVDETVRERSATMWSLSPLVFPHQLVRLMLVEQIYRSQEIAAGRPYHHA